MKHSYIVGFIVALFVLLLSVVLSLIITPAAAYEGDRVTTRRQDELHTQAELMRELGYTEAEIAPLSEDWWREQEALDIVAKVIQNEADPAWCEWEHSVAVGAVVMNRVRSPYFPNTVREVVAAPGQYLEAYTRDFGKVTRLAYEAAKAAIDGDHDVPDDAYWQDCTIQGVSIWKAFTLDTGWFRSTTYICRGIPGVV